MELSNFSFFSPSPMLREMNILRIISQEPTISQGALAKATGIVASMVNRYIYDLEKDDLLIKEGENKRNMSYKLTLKGQFRLQFLTITYLNEVSSLYTQSHDIFLEVLTELKRNQITNLYLYGAGIIGGIVAEVLRFEDYEILGFIDDSTSKQNGNFHGFNIVSPKTVNDLSYDGIVIASFRHSEKMYKNASEIGLNNIFCFEISELGTVKLKKMGGNE
ncbi:MAG TPA: winged helix-turn-helix transcriptional regulator [Thermotogota bacterium]|nr:winged helix-turn-helix transcriptional regulator [Thermotogota bacterium]